MSNKIDERVVALRFDTKQFEQGVKSTTDNLGKLSKSLEMEGAKRGLTELQGAASKFSLQGMADGVSSLASKFGALSIIGITALANITSKAVDAGLQLAKSLTIAPIADGFAEYELKMGSIQTIMAGTGESLQAVSGYLDDLNKYADRTIYSFADMTSNIGKFTNAGVGLDSAVKAIQGISNVAALSGANANEASRAMYNFSQAIAAGHVQLIDWKSIEMANMATAEFKTQLMDSAVAAGTLTKGVDGMYSTIQGTPLSATKNFNQSLQDQWMTTDVLTSTLARYSDETTDIGKRAFAAAQDVKTFTQMLDTMKEAVGSGWAQTFEILLGDFDEAKKLWTSINTVVGGFINQTSDMRNELLKGWADLGGRTVVIDALSKAFEALVSLVKPVAKAFGEVFTPVTADMLYAASLALKDFASGLVLSEQAATRVGTVFKGLFRFIKLVVEILYSLLRVGFAAFSGLARIVGAFLGLFAPLIDYFTALDKKLGTTGGEFTSIADRISSLIDRAIMPLINFLGNLRTAIDELIKSKFGGFVDKMEEGFNPLAGLGEKVRSVWENVRNFVAASWAIIQPIATKVGQFFADFGRGISDALTNVDQGLLLGAANTGILAYVAYALSNLFKSGGGILDQITSTFKGLGGLFDELTGVLSAMQAELKAKALIKIAIAIGILAAAMLVMSSIDPAGIGSAAMGMGTIVAALVGATVALDKFTTVKGAAKLPFIIASLLGLAAAVLVMSVALKLLSTMTWDEIGRGLTVLAGALIIMVGAMLLLSKVSGRAFIAAQAMIAMSTAMLIMGGALKIFASMSWDELGRGLLGFAGVMAIMVVSLLALSSVGMKVIVAAAAMVAVGVAINILAGAIAILGSMDPATLVQGIGAMAVVMIMMGAAIMLLSQNALGTAVAAVALIALSVALYSIAGVIAILGSMDMGSLVQGIGALAVVLTVLIVAMNLMSGAIAGAFSMMVVAGALLMLAAAIGMLGSMPIGMLVQGLLAMVAVFVIMGVAALVLAPLTPVLLALGGAIALTAVGMVLMAGAMAIFALALGIFAANAGPAGVGLIALAAAIVQIGPALPLVVAAGAAFLVFGVGAVIAAVGIIALGAAFIVLAGGMALIGITAPMGTAAMLMISAAMVKLLPQALSFAAVGAAFVVLGAGLIVLGAGALVAGAGLMVFGVAMALMSSVGNKGATVLAKVVEKIAGLVGQAIPLGVMTGVLIALGAGLVVLGAGALLSGTGLLLFSVALMKVIAGSVISASAFDAVGGAIKRLQPTVAIMTAVAAAVMMLGMNFGIAGAGGRSAASGITAMVISTTVGAGAIRNMASVIMSMIPASMAVISRMGPTTSQAVSQVVSNFSALSRGISGTAPSLAASAVALIAVLAATLIGRLSANNGGIFNQARYTGSMVSEGMAAGIRNGMPQVVAAADQVAANALAAANKRLNIHSPSREFEETGYNADRGLAKGFLKNVGLVENASSRVAGVALDTMKKAMGKVAEYVQMDFDSTPTIRPTLDLTDIRNGASSIAGLMGINPLVTRGLAQDASRVSGEINDRQNQWDSSSGPLQNVTNLTFNQELHSPEALSRAEIYRQTRNQFTAAKGALKDNANQSPNP